MSNHLHVYLTDEARDKLQQLKADGVIPKGWSSQAMQQAIIKEYEQHYEN